MNAYILAGGKSLRLKKDKALLRYKGRFFIDIAIECTAYLFNRVYLVGREYDHPLLIDCYPDDIEGIGPLGGIYTALKHTRSNSNFFTGIDYPFIDPDIIIYLADIFHKKQSLNYQGCIPVMPDGAHPLFAFYGKSCLVSAERCIEQHAYHVQCIAQYSRIYYHRISPENGKIDFKRFEKNFVNINRLRDYRKLIHE